MARLDSAFLSSLSHALIVVVVSAISDEHTKLIKACHIFRSFPLISFLSDRSLYMSTKNNSSFSDLEKPQGEFDGKACAAIEQLDVTSSQLLVNGFFRDACFKKQLSDTVHSLLDLRVIPIFNENDAVSTRKAPYETSGSLYGALIGSVLAFNVADFLALVTALAPNLPILVIGRFVYGIGIGLAGYGIGSLLVDTVAGWRYMYGVSSPLAVIMGIGMCWLPASPRWLILCAIQGKGDGENLKSTAIHCLSRLRGQAVEDSAHRKMLESPYHWCKIGLVSTGGDMQYHKMLLQCHLRQGILMKHKYSLLLKEVLLGPPINWKASYRNWQRPKEELEEDQRKIEEVAKFLCWEKKSEEAEISIWQKTMDTESCRSRQEESSVNFYETTNVNDVW
ncbi:D-xylose-proton symporter-like [Arachis hypogaea]|uniref:D-xylose-proton symporter-like n=1 Tax=Arachis hypogaea TaxID=3818 RepID=A0A6B9V7V9_ARAHY|nr:D-xylose-proton symporter-like [Arachis hypogaea]